MKKVLVSIVALAGLAGCASYYDYYKGDVRYTQDGEDCIYYVGEYGNHFSNEIRSAVYQTACHRFFYKTCPR